MAEKDKKRKMVIFQKEIHLLIKLEFNRDFLIGMILEELRASLIIK